MMPLSYRSQKAEVRESKIHGRGLFAITDIAKNEIVAVKGGHIIHRKTLRERVTPHLGPVEIQIDDDLFIAPVTAEDYSVECKCGVPNCRKILTGKDWQRPDLQKRYAGHFSAYLADKIARQAMLER
jgi:hypothetical protein